MSTFARNSDPATSHLAADSVRETKAAQRAVVMYVLRGLPQGVTDEELVDMVARVGVNSPSGVRTRRCELVRAGLVHDTGQRRRTRGGRQAVVWAASRG